MQLKRNMLPRIILLVILQLIEVYVGSSFQARSNLSSTRSPAPSPLSIPCVQRSHCNSIELNREVNSGEDPLPFHARNCFCDDVCLMYGDCCPDYTGLVVAGRGLIKRPKSVSYVTCQRVEMIDTSYEIYIIASCPTKYSDKYVRTRCEKDYLSLDDLFLRLPVTDRNTRILYRNVYCAICSMTGEKEQDLSYWLPVYTCDASAASRFFNDDRMTHAELQGLMSHCRVEIQPPAGADPPRKCKSNIDSCPRKGDSDSKLVKKCRNGSTSYVYHRLQVFKNRFCAQCNRLEVSDMNCEDGRTPRTQFDLGYVDSVESESSSVTGQVSQPGLTKLFLDVGTGTGNLTKSNGLSRTVTIEDDCSTTEGVVLDPFKGECRLIGCSGGWMFINGDCVVDPNYIPPSTPSTTVATTSISTTVITTTSTTASTKSPTTKTVTADLFIDKLAATKRPRKSKTRPTTGEVETATMSLLNTKPLPTVGLIDIKSDEIDKILNFKLQNRQKIDDTDAYDINIEPNVFEEEEIMTTSARNYDKPFKKSHKSFGVHPLDKIASTVSTTFADLPKVQLPVSIAEETDRLYNRNSNFIDSDDRYNDLGSADIYQNLNDLEEFKTTTATNKIKVSQELQEELLNPILGADNHYIDLESNGGNLQKFFSEENKAAGSQSGLSLSGASDDQTSDTIENSKARSSAADQYNSNLSLGKFSPEANYNSKTKPHPNSYNDTFKYFIVFQYRPIEGLVTFITSIVSCCALVGALLVLKLFPMSYTSNMNKGPLSFFSFSLLLCQITYLLALISNSPQGGLMIGSMGCFYIAALLHFFLLVSFLWMNILTIDLCRVVFSNQSKSRSTQFCSSTTRLVIYSMYAWIIPALIITAGIVMDFYGLDVDIRPHYGESGVCWITGSHNQLILFAGPLVLLTLVDSILFVIIARRLCTTITSHADVIRYRHWLLLCVGLCVCICATWMCAFGSTFVDQGRRAGHIAFILLNGAQGCVVCTMCVLFCHVKCKRNSHDSDDSELIWKVDAVNSISKKKADRQKDYKSSNGAPTAILTQETSM